MATAKHKDYSGTPLPTKLGIVTAKPKPCEVALIGAPDAFRDALGELPLATFTARVKLTTNLAIVFTRTAQDVDAAFDLLAAQLPPTASAWIAWPKSRLKPGFNENHVRDAGLARGLVDYKVCSIDEDWSGLKFAWRKTP
jgi:hypothetical protein